LVIQDTTVLRSNGGGGDYLHAVIALDEADGAILGLVDGRFLRRTSGRKAERRELPIEEKESFRWLEGAEQAASVCAGADRITVIADREADIYEAFALRPEGTDLLIRAAQDRSLEDGGKLFAAQPALWRRIARCCGNAVDRRVRDRSACGRTACPLAAADDTVGL
jgi:hypothetical protein